MEKKSNSIHASKSKSQQQGPRKKEVITLCGSSDDNDEEEEESLFSVDSDSDDPNILRKEIYNSASSRTNRVASKYNGCDDVDGDGVRAMNTMEKKSNSIHASKSKSRQQGPRKKEVITLCGSSSGDEEEEESLFSVDSDSDDPNKLGKEIYNSASSRTNRVESKNNGCDNIDGGGVRIKRSKQNKKKRAQKMVTRYVRGIKVEL